MVPASIAKVVPLLLDHGIQVHRFTEPTTMELEVYDAIGVTRTEYFQGHYLKSVTNVEKKTEKVQVPAGWFYVSTAQAKGNLISYLMEPETDDNLITWGYIDNVMRVTPATVEEAMAGLLGDNDITSLTPEQKSQMETRAAAMMKGRQRVPMMRVVTEQPKNLLEVTRYTALNRTRYANPGMTLANGRGAPGYSRLWTLMWKPAGLLRIRCTMPVSAAGCRGSCLYVVRRGARRRLVACAPGGDLRRPSH